MNEKDFLAMSHWYAVHTKPRQETVAEQHLQRQEYEVYLPRILKYRRRRGNIVQVIEPLFPRYLFIRLNLAVDNAAPIRSTTGVSNMVRFGSRIRSIPDEVIEFLQRSADEDKGLHVLKPPPLSKGDAVVVLDGPFAGIAGIFVAEKGEDRVMILLQCLGRTTPVALHKRLVEPA